MKLVHNKDSEEERFATYVECPEEGCIYTLENGHLCQYPMKASGEGFWETDGSPVDWSCGVAEHEVPRMRQIEALLKEELNMAEAGSTLESPGKDAGAIEPRDPKWGITKAQAIAEVNRRLEQPDPDRAFFRRIRAIYEQQVRRIVPEIEDDICELVAEESMADDGIVERI